VIDLETEVSEQCVAGQARGVRASERQASGLVAAAQGDGLIEIFESLGAVAVEGGEGGSPSVGELVAAIDDAPSDAVIVLTNHSDVVSSAEEAAAKSDKRVSVLRTRSLPEGVAAAAAFNPLEDLNRALAGMDAVVSEVESIEVARATRGAGTPSGPAHEGQWLGSRLGEVEAVADEPAAAAAAVAGRFRGDHHDLATVYVGDGADPHDTEAVAAALREALPGLEVEVHHGGQPHYAYLIGLE